MAAAGGLPKWDEMNHEEHELYFIRYRNNRDILNKHLPSLVQSVDPSPLMPHLLHLNVINKMVKENIMHNATSFDSVQRLVDHIQRGPCWRLHGFLRACCLTGQADIVRKLGFDPREYTDNIHTDSFSTRSNGIHVPAGCVFNERIKSKMCLMLSREIGESWFPLGICLKMESSALENIKSCETKNFPLEMLLKWKQMQEDPNNELRLKEMLCNALETELRHELVQPIRDSPDTLEKLFVDLSPHLIGSWEKLGIQLGVQQFTMNLIKAVPKKNHDECAEEMLERWNNGPHKHDIKMLKSALISVHRNDLAKKVDEYLSKYF